MVLFVCARADLKIGSGTAELDQSECVLVFCTSYYFEKRISLKELFRAVCQNKHILAMLEPDVAQHGGLNQVDVQALITNAKLDKFQVCCASRAREVWGMGTDVVVCSRLSPCGLSASVA
jgi:hypothetical protein